MGGNDSAGAAKNYVKASEAVRGNLSAKRAARSAAAANRGGSARDSAKVSTMDKAAAAGKKSLSPMDKAAYEKKRIASFQKPSDGKPSKASPITPSGGKSWSSGKNVMSKDHDGKGSKAGVNSKITRKVDRKTGKVTWNYETSKVGQHSGRLSGSSTSKKGAMERADAQAAKLMRSKNPPISDSVKAAQARSGARMRGPGLKPNAPKTAAQKRDIAARNRRNRETSMTREERIAIMKGRGPKLPMGGK
jgi:hypothetical protein